MSTSLLAKGTYVLHKEREDLIFPTKDRRTICGCTRFGRLTLSSVTIILLVTWSSLCVWLSNMLVDAAKVDIEGNAAKWLLWLHESNIVVYRIGGIFTFATIFRFQTCYNRWWDGRIVWGDIMSTCVDLDQMNHTFIKDDGVTDRLSRFIIVFVYACKSILRHESVLDNYSKHFQDEKILSESDLLLMKKNKGWEPQYALNIIRHMVADTFNRDDVLLLPPNKMPINAQVLRSFENNITKLHDLIGNAIRLRETGLPQTYDYVHTCLFYMYFVLASTIWAPRIGWMLPMVIFCFSPVCLALIQLGTDLIDPFGTDFVDLPLDFFCKTTELQIRQNSKHKVKRTGILKPSSSYLKKKEDNFISKTNPIFKLPQSQDNVRFESIIQSE